MKSFSCRNHKTKRSQSSVIGENKIFLLHLQHVLHEKSEFPYWSWLETENIIKKSTRISVKKIKNGKKNESKHKKIFSITWKKQYPICFV